MMTRRVILMGCLGGGLFVTGCVTETQVGHATRPDRAVASPLAMNDTTGEIAQMTEMEGVRIVTVGFPNKSGEPPVVRTIADDFAHPPMEPQPVRVGEQPVHSAGITVTTTQPGTQPATKPAEPRGVRVDPLLGPGE